MSCWTPLFSERRPADDGEELEAAATPCGARPPAASDLRRPRPDLPSRNFDMMRSSMSAQASSIFSRNSLHLALRVLGDLDRSYFWPFDSSLSKIAGLHLDEIDDALVLLFLADRVLNRDPGVTPRRSLMEFTFISKSAPTLSILLTNTMRGTRNLSAWRQSRSRVCGSTPLPPSSTATRSVEDAEKLPLDPRW